MPDIEKFKSSEAYYSALYHEGIHNAECNIMPNKIKITSHALWIMFGSSA
jgi:hypothetical protein